MLPYCAVVRPETRNGSDPISRKMIDFRILCTEIKRILIHLLNRSITLMRFGATRRMSLCREFM